MSPESVEDEKKVYFVFCVLLAKLNNFFSISVDDMISFKLTAQTPKSTQSRILLSFQFSFSETRFSISALKEELEIQMEKFQHRKAATGQMEFLIKKHLRQNSFIF